MTTIPAKGDFLRRRHRFTAAEALPWILLVAAFFAFPGYLTLGVQVLIMILFALSLDLILGYAGIITLGHAAFFGLGAYTAGILSVQGWGEPISGLLLAAVVAGIVGFLSGWAILRTTGLTLLMLTLSLAELLREIANEQEHYTGGDDGLRGISMDPLLGIFEFDLFGETAYIYCLVVLFLLFLVTRAIVHSPFGQSLTGIRENIRRMHAVGAPVQWRLITAYAISAAIAGVAGALLAQTTEYVGLQFLSFVRSGDVLIIIILGGFGRLYGAFIGAPIYMILQDQLAKQSPEYWLFGIGLVLVLTVLFAPRGFLGLIQDAARLFRGDRR